MVKNQININADFFAYINNIKIPLFVDIYGRKNNKIIKFRYRYEHYPLKMSLKFFVQKLKDNYHIPEEFKSEKEIIEYCQQQYKINEQKHT